MKAKRIKLAKAIIEWMLQGKPLTMKGLPQDVAVHSCWWRPEWQSFECILTSEEWGWIVTNVGQSIPELKCEMTQEGERAIVVFKD